MFMGSQHVPTGDFDRLLEAAGAQNNGSTTEDRTNYYEDGPANALPLMLWLDSDRMGFLLPEITADKVDIQRGVVQERAAPEVREPALRARARRTSSAGCIPAEPPYRWPVIGSMADLSAATHRGRARVLQDVLHAEQRDDGDRRRRHAAEVRQLVERYFGDIPRGPEITRTHGRRRSRSRRTSIHTLEDRVQLPRVYNAWHTRKAFRPTTRALEVLAGVLAGGKSSRLYQRLVYELQIASQVAAYQDGGRLDGKFVIFATARPGHALDELQRVIDEEVRKLAASGPDAARTGTRAEQHRGAVLSAHGAGRRVLGGKANQLNYYNYFVGEPDYIRAGPRPLPSGDARRRPARGAAVPRRRRTASC